MARLPLLVLAVVTAFAVPAAAAVSGPDVSHYQHDSGHAITWTAVKASGQAFTFHKATEGTTYQDPTFPADWTAAKSVGLVVGAYHFARPSSAPGSAEDQARYFVAYAGNMRHPGELAPVLDLEVTGGLKPAQLITWTRTWLTTVASLTGRTPIVYSYPSFWKTAMAGTTAFRGYPLWGACYCSAPTTFEGAWTHWTFWQYTSSSAVAGIAGKTDMNHFNGTLAQLKSLAFGTTSTTPQPTASTVTKLPTHLVGTAPTAVRAMRPFTMSGTLRTTSGKPVPGQRVTIMGRKTGATSWHEVRRLTTTAASTWSTTLRAPYGVQLFARYAGSATTLASASAVRTITVAASRHR